MALKTPLETQFETTYTAKFKILASKYGFSIEYEKDIAGIDLGLHLVAGEKVTNTKVWFQFKGLHADTLSKTEFESSEFISYQINIEHLRAWYNFPEVVYVVLYIEAIDAFIAEDVRDIVDRKWGGEVLNDKLFKPNQEKVTIKLKKQLVDDENFWKRLYSHKSMRTDGKSFRGRPLGHSYDPLRTSLRVMDSSLFENIVDDLLHEHEFQSLQEINVDNLFATKGKDKARLLIGILHQKYEIVLQILNEFLPDENNFRIEGESDFHQGKVLVFIHSQVESLPDQKEFGEFVKQLVEEHKIKRLLIFSNSSFNESPSWGHYRLALEEIEIKCRPQQLEDLSFNFLTTNHTYEKFKDKVSFWGGKIWIKEEGPFYLYDPVTGEKTKLS